MSLEKQTQIRFLKSAFLVLFALLLLLGIFMPLQTDEICWGLQNQRAITDHGQLTTLMPQCHAPADITETLPLSWYPHAVVNHALFMLIDEPFWIRVVGIGRYILFLAAGWFVIKAVAPRLNWKPSTLAIGFLACLSLDALPLLLEVTRPEQPILLASTIFLALVLNVEAIAISRARYLALGFYLLVMLLVFPVHPKTIAILPLVLLCGIILSYRISGSKWFAGLIAVIVIAFVMQSTFVWLQRYQCNYMAEAKSIVEGHSLPLGKLMNDPRAFIKHLLRTLKGILFYDFSLDFQQLKYDWLPPSVLPIPQGVFYLQGAQALLGFFLRLGIFLFCLGFASRTLFYLLKRKTLTLSLYADNRHALIGITLIISLLSLMVVSGSIRMFYFITLHVPLLWFSFILCLSAKGSLDKRYDKWFIWILLLALSNMTILLTKYTPYVFSNDVEDYLRDNRVIMRSAWNYKEQKEKVLQAYNACGFSPVDEVKHLVLDDYTYPVLRHSFQPYHFHYATNLFFKKTEDFKLDVFLTFLKDYHAEGVIIDCRHVPDTLRPHMQEHSGYCCMKTNNTEPAQP